MYSHITTHQSIPTTLSENYYHVLFQIMIWFWVIYHPNISMSFCLATLVLPFIYHQLPPVCYSFWYHHERQKSLERLQPPPGIGHRWHLMLPSVKLLRASTWLIPCLLWLDRPVRVLFLVWSFYIALYPLHPAAFHHLPFYVHLQPTHLTWQNTRLIWRYILYQPLLTFRS